MSLKNNGLFAVMGAGGNPDLATRRPLTTQRYRTGGEFRGDGNIELQATRDRKLVALQAEGDKARGIFFVLRGDQRNFNPFLQGSFCLWSVRHPGNPPQPPCVVSFSFQVYAIFREASHLTSGRSEADPNAVGELSACCRTAVGEPPAPCRMLPGGFGTSAGNQAVRLAAAFGNLPPLRSLSALSPRTDARNPLPARACRRRSPAPARRQRSSGRRR